MTTDTDRKQVLDRMTKYITEHLNDIPADARLTASKLQKWLEPRRTAHPTDYNSVRAVWRRLEAVLTGTISAPPTAPKATPVSAATFEPVSVAAVAPVAEPAAPVDVSEPGPAAPAPAAPIDLAPVMPPAPTPAPAPVYNTKNNDYGGQARARSSYGK